MNLAEEITLTFTARGLPCAEAKVLAEIALEAVAKRMLTDGLAITPDYNMRQGITAAHLMTRLFLGLEAEEKKL